MENKTAEDQKRNNADALICLYKNAHIGLQSISNVLDEVDDTVLKQQLSASYDGYEKMIGNLSTLMAEMGVVPKEPNFFKKAMIWGSSKMNAMKDNSVSHIASMMIQGTVMGSNEIREMLSASGAVLDERVISAANDLLAYEEEQESLWKKLA